MSTFTPLLERSIEVDAPADRVWELVHDVRRMAEWSPQVDSSRLRDGWERVGMGAQFTNRNTRGELAWVTHGEVVRFEVGQELAFRIEENHVIWSFRLERLTEGRTRIVQRRETPEGISAMSLRLTEEHLGGQEAFTREMLEGMDHTLSRIRAAAEGG